MAHTLTDRYRRWFEYEKDSHAKVLLSLNAAPPAARSMPEYRKAVTLMSHIVASRRLWLFRLGGIPSGPKAEDFFPEGVSLPDLASAVEAMHDAWSAHLARLDDEAIVKPFEYQSLEGEWFRNTVVDILTQLYGHSLYHRGQIALLLRNIGAEPATTDFVFWTREPIQAPAEASRQ